MIAQVWIHRPSGCKYAVAFDKYESPVTEASIDLESQEVEIALLEGFDSDPDQVEWINEHSDEFDLHAYLNDGAVVFN